MSFKWEWREIDPADLGRTMPTNKDNLDQLEKLLEATRVNHCSSGLHQLRPFFEGSRQRLYPDSDFPELDRSVTDPTSSLSVVAEPDPDTVIGETPYYLDDPAIRGIIEGYRRYSQDQKKWLTLTLPIGAMHFMQAMNRSRPTTFMIGDKGYAGLVDLHFRRDPHIAVHGSLSFMVNMHAIKAMNSYFGGEHISSPYGNNFQIMCLMGKQNDNDEFIKSHSQLIAKAVELLQDPPDSPLLSMDMIRSNPPGSLKTVLGLLRCLNHDSDAINTLSKQLLEKDGTSTLTQNPRMEHDLIRDLLLIHDNWYHFTEEDGKLPLTLAFIAMRMGRVRHALRFLADVPPPQRDASYQANVATCYQSLGNHTKAVHASDLALEQNPGFVSALRIKQSSALMLNPIKMAIFGAGPTIEADLLHNLVIDGRIKIIGIATRSQSCAARIASLLKQIGVTLDSISILVEPDDLHLTVEKFGPFNAALVDDGYVSHFLLKTLFKSGIHVLSGAPVPTDKSDELVSQYIRERHSLYSEGRFLNWHQIPGPINSEAKHLITEQVGSADNLLTVSIEYNYCLEKSEFDEALLLQSSRRLEKIVAANLRLLVTRLHELLDSMGIKLESLYLNPSPTSTLGWFVSSLDDETKLQGGIVAGASAAPSYSRIVIQLTNGDLTICFDSPDLVVIKKRVGIRERVVGSGPDGIKAKIDMFIEHYIQEQRNVERSFNESEMNTSSRRLTLGVDHALKYRAVMQAVENYFPSYDQ